VELFPDAEGQGGGGATDAALRGIDLTIEPGGRVAPLGPDGAGKTTAVRILLGLASPTTGASNRVEAAWVATQKGWL